MIADAGDSANLRNPFLIPGAKVRNYFKCCFSLRSFDFRLCSKLLFPFPIRSKPFQFVQMRCFFVISLVYSSLIRTFAPYEVNITNPNDDNDDEL